MRHGHLINRWVVIDGARTSYRGKLVTVIDLGAEAILQLHPCYALEALADTKNEVKLNTTVANPWDLYSQACLGVGLQPIGWPNG